jgi:hypothetical protein
VARGAAIADDFSTRPTVELQTIQRESPSLPLAMLLNHRGVEMDDANRRIWGDSFSKGSLSGTLSLQTTPGQQALRGYLSLDQDQPALWTRISPPAPIS